MICRPGTNRGTRPGNLLRVLGLLVAAALLLCGCASQEERAYRAAKKKLEAAKNVSGAASDEEHDAAWREALDALVAVGDYEDAPALADEAREYFYNNAVSWFWQINGHDDALDRVQACLDIIPGYRDAADWGTLNGALRLAMDGRVAEAAELVRTLPESFDDNLFRNAILLLDDCRQERWPEALDRAQPLYQQTLEDGNGNAHVVRTNCLQEVLSSSGLEMFEDYASVGQRFGGILLRYYAQQVEQGNDLSKLEAWPCVLGTSCPDTPFGPIQLEGIYGERAKRARESLEAYGVSEAYAKVGTITIEKVPHFVTDLYGTRVDGFREERRVEEGSVPEPPTEITGSGICLLSRSNHYEGIRVNAEDLVYRVEPTCLADSVESMRYVCRFYHDYTKTYRVVYSSGGESGQYYINTSIQLIDLVTGETLLTCDYYEDQHDHDSNRDEVINRQLVPALRELVTIYP